MRYVAHPREQGLAAEIAEALGVPTNVLAEVEELAAILIDTLETVRE